MNVSRSLSNFSIYFRSTPSRAFTTGSTSHPLRNGQINESPEECISIAAPNTVSHRYFFT